MRSGPVPPGTAAKVGTRVRIWVDADSNTVAPPTPPWRAMFDGIGSAMVTLLLVVIGVSSLVSAVRSRLGRAREEQWELALRCLQDDEGRKHQS
jgi:hypothetical protein